MQQIGNQMVFSAGEPLTRMFYASVAMSPGHCVALDTAVSTGDYVTLPAAEADPKVFAVVAGDPKVNISYAAGDLVPVVIEGPTKVWANGTDNIAAGNPLMAYSTDGIAYIDANALSCAFGTALEAYTTNDSLGWINVYVKKGSQQL